MNKLLLFVRNISPIQTKLLCPFTYQKEYCCKKGTKIGPSSSSSSSSSSSDSDRESARPKKSDTQARREESLQKLNNLLNKLIEKDNVISEVSLNLAQPTNKRKKGREENDTVIKKETIEKKIVSSVQAVAKEIGGDIKQTESELLAKLLNPVEATTETTKRLSDIMKGMQIDRDTKPAEKSRSDQVRNLLQNVQQRTKTQERVQTERKSKRHIMPRKPERTIEKINLFGGEPLGIFTNKDLKSSDENTFWQTLYERDLKLAVTHPPANYFQQMILWTEQGKLWTFPIDNEQGLDEEKKVYFAKHVFLEDHLEPWCPPKGPIRHFMELVCVGLSKNPYITVETKLEHIEWYKNYFEDKKKLLLELGAIPAQNDTPQKSIE